MSTHMDGFPSWRTRLKWWLEDVWYGLTHWIW